MVDAGDRALDSIGCGAEFCTVNFPQIKRWAAKTGIILLTVSLVAEVAYQLVANEALRYFAEQPGRLLSVGAIAISGGLAVLLFNHLSPRWKRGVGLCGMGLFAISSTVFTGYFAWLIHNLSHSMENFGVRPERGIFWGLAWPLGICVLAWVGLYRVSTKRVS